MGCLCPGSGRALIFRTEAGDVKTETTEDKLVVFVRELFTTHLEKMIEALA